MPELLPDEVPDVGEPADLGRELHGRARLGRHPETGASIVMSSDCPAPASNVRSRRSYPTPS